MDRLLKLPLVAALVCGAAPVYAAEAAADAAATGAAADSADQGQIVVTGQRTEYGVRKTSTATKTNTDVRNIPQALTVISEGQIEDQQLRSIADLLNFVPGASWGTGEGNRDTVVLRGNSSTADFFIDGVRDDVQYFRDFYNVDRVEVLKGPNAMIFGRGGGGGIVNRVLKRPSLNPYRQFTASGDRFGDKRFTADFDQPLTDSVGLRVNGMFEDGDSFRHHVELKRYGINPTAAVQVGPDTRIDLSYEYFHDRRTADRGLPSDSGEPLEGFTRTFFGDPDKSFAKANVNLASFAVEHHFGEGLTLRNRTLYGDYDKFYQNVFPGGAVSSADTVSLSAYNDTTTRKNLFSQTDLIWETRLGGIDQTLLAGFEVGRQKSRQRRRNGFFLASDSASLVVPISDPTVEEEVVFLPFNTTGGCRPSNQSTCTPANFTRGKLSTAAFYVQDQVRISPMFEIVAGLRFDRFDLDITNLNNSAEFSRTDNLWSPRLGLILKPADSLSLYASYSRSYLPQSGDQFGGLTDITEGLKPERFDNYEIGAKWEPIEGLLATAAVYQLERTNTRATDPLDPSHIVLTGEQRSRGIEVGLERSVTSRWLISAGYTLQKAEITKTTAAAPKGREVPLVPRHSFSLWNRYDFAHGIGVGLGLIARSKSYASISNAVKLPGYARADAALFYQLPRGIQTQINVENLFGAHYFPSSNGDNNIAPGAPRTIRATVGYRF
jgi:catecholate siderophore receptor